MEKPTLPKGTRDFGPSTMAKRQFILSSIKSVFQKFGFLPLETPAMENLSVLTGKYGEEGDQLLFKILNSGDYLKDVNNDELAERNSRKVTPQIAEKGLRYDLTVPFARYVVMNRHDITLPFKRYQIQPVWRADRPQKGRYREFYQCDADVVGTKSLICEMEVIAMIKEVFQLLGITDYSIKVNHRGILSGIAEYINVGGKETDLFVAIDKLEKIGENGVRAELHEKGFAPDAIDQLFSLLNFEAGIQETLLFLGDTLASNPTAVVGVEDLSTVFSLLEKYGLDTSNVQLDITLARGLSYYTGTIFEVKVNNVSIGSVSGGGRYDNLTQAFGSRESLTGIGFSFGVDRLYDALDELQLFPDNALQSTIALVCPMDDHTQQFGLEALFKLRAAGIPSEIYPDTSKLKKQLDYANKKGIPFAIVIGSEETQSGNLVLKDMTSGQQDKLTIEAICQQLAE